VAGRALAAVVGSGGLAFAPPLRVWIYPGNVAPARRSGTGATGLAANVLRRGPSVSPVHAESVDADGTVRHNRGADSWLRRLPGLRRVLASYSPGTSHDRLVRSLAGAGASAHSRDRPYVRDLQSGAAPACDPCVVAQLYFWRPSSPCDPASSCSHRDFPGLAVDRRFGLERGLPVAD